MDKKETENCITRADAIAFIQAFIVSKAGYDWDDLVDALRELGLNPTGQQLCELYADAIF